MGKYKRRSSVVAFALVSSLAFGCVTVAEFRKLERQVVDQGRTRSTAESRQSLADLSAQVDQMNTKVAQLQGRLDVAEKTASDALAEARRARQQLAAASAAGGAVGAPADSTAGVAGAVGVAETGNVSEEVIAYRAAYASWRSGDHASCIDQFRKFLQTYPSSAYADDSAFWMADCHFKQGDYKNAVLRFDDVSRNYPTGNKAADALYRQGESLLKLGPSFHGAAKRAFERVVEEYPTSARASEAKKQVELLAKG